VSPRTSTTLPRSSRSFSHHVETLSTIPAWLFEPKYDGYRGLLYVTRQGCYSGPSGGTSSITGGGRDLFDAAQRLDLEGIVAKRKSDAYAAGVTWYKIKNRANTQGEGRWGLFQRK
jgi:ATP-dependent DNA ligase